MPIRRLPKEKLCHGTLHFFTFLSVSENPQYLLYMYRRNPYTNGAFCENQDLVDFVKIPVRYGHNGATVTRSGLLRVFGLTERLVYGPYGPRGCQYVDCRGQSRATEHFTFSDFCQLAKTSIFTIGIPIEMEAAKTRILPFERAWRR